MAFKVFFDAGPEELHTLQRGNVGGDFPTDELTVTWQMYLTTNRASAFQTQVAVGPTTFTGASDYFAAFDGNGAISNNFGIGSDGSDTYHGSIGPVAGAWFRQAFRRRFVSANNWEQLFYLDLGAGVATVSRADTSALALAAAAVLMFGCAPWATITEFIDGKMRYLKLWSVALAEADLQAESANPGIVTSAGGSNLWGRWPCNYNGLDVSGNNRHLSAMVEPVIFEPDPIIRGSFAAFPKSTLRYPDAVKA